MVLLVRTKCWKAYRFCMQNSWMLSGTGLSVDKFLNVGSTSHGKIVLFSYTNIIYLKIFSKKMVVKLWTKIWKCWTLSAGFGEMWNHCQKMLNTCLHVRILNLVLISTFLIGADRGKLVPINDNWNWGQSGPKESNWSQSGLIVHNSAQLGHIEANCDCSESIVAN